MVDEVYRDEIINNNEVISMRVPDRAVPGGRGLDNSR